MHEADDAAYDANHAPFELVSHDEVEDVLEVLTNAGGRWDFHLLWASRCGRPFIMNKTYTSRALDDFEIE